MSDGTGPLLKLFVPLHGRIRPLLSVMKLQDMCFHLVLQRKARLGLFSQNEIMFHTESALKTMIWRNMYSFPIANAVFAFVRVDVLRVSRATQNVVLELRRP